METDRIFIECFQRDIELKTIAKRLGTSIWIIHINCMEQFQDFMSREECPLIQIKSNI